MIDIDDNEGFELDDDTDTEDAFGPRAGHAASSEGDFEEFDAPVAPIGVLPAFVKAGKKLEKDGKTLYVLEFECTDPRYAKSDAVALFVNMSDGKTRPRYMKVAAALGVASSTTDDGKLRIPTPAMLVNKHGLVTYSTYVDERDGIVKPTIAWGYPSKNNASDAFDAWAKEQALTEEQVKLIKQSPGVMPAGSF